MPEIKTLSLINRTEWRKWLERNHNKESEIWLIHYKKHSKTKGIPYKDAVEEAICFGWIDSKMKRIDDEKFILRYSPRKKNSVWSEINKNTALKMMKEGKISPEGLAKIEEAKQNGNWTSAYTSKKKPNIPPDLKKALMECPNAWENFNKLSNTSQLQYVFRINTAKLKTTRIKRIEEVVRRVRTVIDSN